MCGKGRISPVKTSPSGARRGGHATPCNAMQRHATPCNAVQHPARRNAKIVEKNPFGAPRSWSTIGTAPQPGTDRQNTPIGAPRGKQPFRGSRHPHPSARAARRSTTRHRPKPAAGFSRRVPEELATMKNKPIRRAPRRRCNASFGKGCRIVGSDAVTKRKEQDEPNRTHSKP